MLTASQKYGMIPQSEFVEKEGRRVVEVIHGKDNLIHVEPDDFVISMRSFQGGLEWCRFTGSTSFHYVPVTPIKHVVPSYFAYLLKSEPYISALRSTTNLIRDGQEIRYSNFVQVALPIVPEEEQISIASFLSYETAKIDALIAEQQRLIGLLQEKRQAVISHAVTKGLNPDAPMKDSGLEWLGEVPEHWEVKPAKRVIGSIEQGWSPQCENYSVDGGEGWGVLKVGCVNGGVFRFTENKSLPVELDPRPELAILNDDLLVSRANTRELVGSAAVADQDYPNLLLCDKLYRLRVDRKEAHPQFLSFFLGSQEARSQIELEASGASNSMLNISQSVILELPCPVPPADEQEVIIGTINHQLSNLVDLVSEAAKVIKLLQERRSALISAAVTGQIDVRGLVPSEAVA